MNCKDTIPVITETKDRHESKDGCSTFPLRSKEEFVDFYCPPVYALLVRLGGIIDSLILEDLTVNILSTTWKEHREQLWREQSGILIYKLSLQKLFQYLKSQKNSDRIRQLEETLPIKQTHYTDSLKTIRKTLIRKIKFLKTWNRKIF